MKVYDRVIITHLIENPYWQNINTIAEGTVMGWATAKKHLEFLVEKDIVIENDEGFYKLKDDSIPLGKYQHILEKR